jgi:hypothetical protein
MSDRWRNILGVVLFVIAGVFFALSVLCVFGGVLAMLGVLADVGPEENQKMGREAFVLALYPLGVGVLFLVAGMLVRRRVVTSGVRQS